MSALARPYLAALSVRFQLTLQYRAAALAGFATQLWWGAIKVMVYAAFYGSAGDARISTRNRGRGNRSMQRSACSSSGCHASSESGSEATTTTRADGEAPCPARRWRTKSAIPCR